MSLEEYAEKELRLAGLFDKDSDYGGMVGEAVLELVRAFAAQGHSGFSASLVLSAFDRVARFKPLTPLTSDPSEWTKVDKRMWQSTRLSTSFSRDGGKTWYDIDDPEQDNGDHWRP